MYNHQYWWNIVWSRSKYKISILQWKWNRISCISINLTRLYDNGCKYKISILPWKWNRISCIIIIHLTWLYDNGCKYKILISPWKQGIRYLLLMWILHDFTNSCKYKILVSPWKHGIRYHLVRKEMDVNEHERLSKHYTLTQIKVKEQQMYWFTSSITGFHEQILQMELK
jgi:hypothetical protein